MTQTTDDVSRTPEPQEILRLAVEYHLRDVAVSLPGQIEEFDPKTQSASVKPLVKRLIATEGGEELEESLPVINGVPVQFPRAGGFYMTVPVKRGDFCHLVFNHYSIDQYKSGNGQDTNPQDFRMHDISDAVAYMGFHPFSKAIKDYDPDNMVLGKEKGKQIHFKPDNTICLGSKTAADALALASKCDARLKLLGDLLQGLSTPPWVPLPTDGGAALLTAAIAVLTVAFPVTVASSVIKAE